MTTRAVHPQLRPQTGRSQGDFTMSNMQSMRNLRKRFIAAGGTIRVDGDEIWEFPGMPNQRVGAGRKDAPRQLVAWVKRVEARSRVTPPRATPAPPDVPGDDDAALPEWSPIPPHVPYDPPAVAPLTPEAAAASAAMADEIAQAKAADRERMAGWRAVWALRNKAAFAAVRITPLEDIAKLIDGHATIMDAERLEAAEIVFGVDLDTGRQTLFYGRDVMDAIHASGRGRQLRILKVGLGLNDTSDDVEILCAACLVVKGQHDYRAGDAQEADDDDA